MHELAFLQDLALVMCIAGVVTVLFHLLKQPVVLGYILAGVILGPHTSIPLSISDEHTIKLLSELGVIFLMFSIGLEFSLRKLKKVGIGAFIIAAIEILIMVWIGYEIGSLFGWGQMNSIFLGAILSISSTTIIAKALEEQGRKKEKFTELIFGVLIVEDILAIVMLVLLSGFAVTGSFHPTDILVTMGKMTLFLTVVLVAGLLAIPRLINFIARFNSNEMLLVAVLGLCFGVSLLTVKMGYSVALGAFLIGAIMAESRHIVTIEMLVQPVRDMFSAVFFVSIGLMINPVMISQHLLPIIMITLAVVIGKIAACAFGAFITGNKMRTSVKVGMSLAQIGEFSFIIAALGLSLKVTDDFLYPIAVAVSALTTLFTPYLIQYSDHLVDALEKRAPQGLRDLLNHYTEWMQTFRATRNETRLSSLLKQIMWKVGLNVLLVIAIFVGGAWALQKRWLTLAFISSTSYSMKAAIIWLSCMIFSLPILIAVHRKLKAFSTLISQMVIPDTKKGANLFLRATVCNINILICNAALTILVLILSSTILPPSNLFIGLAVLILISAYFLRDYLGHLHNKAQIALAETFESGNDSLYSLASTPLRGFTGFTVTMITLTQASPAVGKLISELQVRTHTGASIVGIQRGETTTLSPKVDEELKADDHILLLGSPQDIERATALLNPA